MGSQQYHCQDAIQQLNGDHRSISAFIITLLTFLLCFQRTEKALRGAKETIYKNTRVNK